MHHKIIGTLALLIFVFLAVSVLPHLLNAQDEYDILREKWKEVLTGGDAFDASDPDIAAQILSINAQAETNWNTMQKNNDRTCLWTDICVATSAEHFTHAYRRLEEMALAYVTPGGALAGNVALKDDVIRGLDWMYANRYNESVQNTSQWWHTEIGTPVSLINSTVLLYDELTPAQVTNYMNAVDKFQPTVTMTGANRTWESIIIALRGIIVKDSAKIAAGRDGLTQVFRYVTSGDGFYVDGSFIQHAVFAYTGGYGTVLLKDIVDLVYLLHGSRWEVVDSAKGNVFRWAYDSYMPLLYKGAMMDMVRGRNISRQVSSGHETGASAVRSLARLSMAASPVDKLALQSLVKYWVTNNTYRNIYSGSTIAQITLIKNIVDDANIPVAAEPVLHKEFPSMARSVHLRPGFGFAISMSSKRIANYEAINDENRKGWYTGEGMTYLYDNDLGQFSDTFWPTVDPYRLPGTTVEVYTRGNGSGASYRSSQNWVGGTDIENLYGTTGMSLDAWNSPLVAKKSWFAFDDEIVAIGSGIMSTTTRTVETIIENRKLTSSGNNDFTVNNVSKPIGLGWSETMSGVTWAHLEGNVPGSDIGYYFPTPSIVKGLRQARTGAWSNISGLIGTPTSTVTANYLTLWFDHGKTPTNGTYEYVLLPNTSEEEVQRYAATPEITVLENSLSLHAVRENTLGVIGANFWDDGQRWLQVDGQNFLSSSQKAAVMTKETENSLSVSVADPTMVGSVTQIEIMRSANAIISSDPGVVVRQLSPTIKLEVNVLKAAGKTFKANFVLASTTPPLPPPNSHILRPAADTYVAQPNPTASFGTVPRIVAKTANGYNRYIYIKFDLSSVTSPITSAKLNLDLAANYTSYPQSGSFVVREFLDNDWNESISWRTRPSDNGNLGAQIGSAKTLPTLHPETVEYDVTDYINSRLAAGASVVSFTLRSVASNNSAVIVHSREISTSTTALVLTLATTTSPEEPAPTQKPTISAFTSDHATIEAGAGTVLRWEVSDATSISINPEVGAVSGNSVIVSPVQTTTYVLTATNSSGDTTASTEITVTTPPQPVTLPPVEDLHVYEQNSSASLGSQSRMVAKTASGLNRYIYLKFDTSPFSGPITSAKLQLELEANNTSYPQTGSFAVRKFLSNNWDESTNWQTRPSDNGNLGAQIGDSKSLPTLQNEVFEVDVTDYVNSQRAAGITTISFTLRSLVSNNSAVIVHSREWPSSETALILR